MTKRVALASGVLLLGLLIAVVGATIALRLIGSETSGPGGRPLSEADVRRSFAKTAGQVAPSSPAATPVPAHRHSPGSRTPGSQSHAPVPHSTIGGTVFASCAAGQVRLTNWIPQSGYSSDGYSPGPATSAWVKFKSSATELTVTATCVGGRPRFTTTTDNRGGGHGGNDSGGGSGSGSGSGGSGH
jgi:hypothetical protein